MERILLCLSMLPVLCGMPGALAAQGMVRHDLHVRVFPSEHGLSARDRVTLPEERSSVITFSLHRGLNPSSPTPGVQIVPRDKEAGSPHLESFDVRLPSGLHSFVLEYEGEIHHPLEAVGREHARGFRQTPGLISEQGVYLSGNSFWYPAFDHALVTFQLQVELPGGWDAVSQGERTIHVLAEENTSVLWDSPEPQEEIFLVAGEFTEYGTSAEQVSAQVFLRTPDEPLANRYLEATARYISMYEDLIGPYPYKKFALVENFWETGYGMPSFTLLGPKVIRFPFILHSSYPHEILHNWWGNSVYPDMRRGNWTEGLTAYLSDHLIKEQQGQGPEYRVETLQKYADYILTGRDFALTQFRTRHGSPSEAVGYGKSLMFFHMLRRELGDEKFVQGLRDIYRSHRFGFASFDDLQRSFERACGKDLQALFAQWITHQGAPEVKVHAAKSRRKKMGYVLSSVLEQVQPGHTYRLNVPVAVTLEGREEAYQTVVETNQRRHKFRLLLPAKPLRLDVDPEFDLFRRLNREEVPPALTQALGAEKMLILLPGQAEPAMLQAYRNFSESLAQSGPGQVKIMLDQEVPELPLDQAVTLLGWENQFLKRMRPALSPYSVSMNPDHVSIQEVQIPRKAHSVVLTARHPDNPELSLTWIAGDLAQALGPLARKLPHYHKYSFLAFQGPEAENVAKGRWPVTDSPMTVFIAQEGGAMSDLSMAKLESREPLAALPPLFSEKRIMDVIGFLTTAELQGRGLGTQGLDRSADFIAERFQGAGLRPAGDGEESYFQAWEDRGGEPERKRILRNVVGLIPGNNKALSGQCVVVGAHYDSLGLGWPDGIEANRGKVHPGADDNASGISVLLELAGELGTSLKPDRSVVFAAFTGEEAGRKGSKHFLAQRGLCPPEQCVGMLNLDTVGRLGKNKLLVLGAGSAEEWVHLFRGAGYVTGVDMEIVPDELGSSDQASFHEFGVPAVQLFSGPHLDYHRPTDTLDKIDPQGLLKVASVAREAILYLAGREEPLTKRLGPRDTRDSSREEKRRVSLGTIPDFAYRGEGCRLAGVVPGAPAEVCGLRQGDIIIRIDSKPIHGLKDLSDLLKRLEPGDRISITVLRQGKEITVEAEVSPRK